jgi:hypothetical protein
MYESMISNGGEGAGISAPFPWSEGARVFPLRGNEADLLPILSNMARNNPDILF